MSNFWSNISRYPRFFISSMAGLVLVILSPFKNLFKTPKLRVFLILFIILFVYALCNIILTMTAM